MGLMQDSLTLYKREMLIFRANIYQNIVRSAIFPILIILIFSSLGSAVSKVPIAIVNYANNQQATQFIGALGGQSGIIVGAITSQDQGMAMLKAGSVDMVVVILPTFPKTTGGSASVQVYYDSGQFQSLAALPLISSVAKGYGAATLAQNQQAQQGTAVLDTPSYAATGNYTTFLVASVIMMSVATGTMFGGGMSTITDRISGNLKSFLITPINKRAIVTSKILSGITQSLFSGMIALAIGIALGGQIAMGFVGLVWIVFVCIILSLGLGAVTMALTSKIKKVEIYAIMVQAIIFPLWFLAGSFFPVSELPTWLQPISAIDPLTYATNGVRDVMLNGYLQIGPMLQDITILVGFAVVMLIISFAMFKDTID